MDSTKDLNNETMTSINYSSIIFMFVYGVIFVLGSIMNTILLIVFIRRPSFRMHLSNRFLINLVLVNLSTCLLWIPLTIYDTNYDITKESTNKTSYICSTILGTSSTLSSITMFAQMLIGIDQHLAVVDSLHYHQRINERLCSVMCISMWILGITLGMLTPADFDSSSEIEIYHNNSGIRHYNYTSIFNACGKEESSLYQKVITITVTTVSFVVPLLLLTVIYSRVFLEAHQNSERTRRNSAASTTMESVYPNNMKSFHYPIQYSGKHLDVSLMNLRKNNPPTPSMRSNNSSLSHIATSFRRSVKYKMSHANAIFLYYGRIEEGRTAKITVLILLMIIFCWTPYYTTSITNVINLTNSPEVINKLTMLCAFSNTILSPLLYAYRSRRVQRDIKKVFGFSFDELRHRHTTNRNRQPYDANRLKRHKSFSCPQLLISDVSASLDEPQFKNNIQHCNQSIGPLKLENDDTHHKVSEIYNNIGFSTYIPNHKLLQPIQLVNGDRRVSESLPKDIEKISSSFGRKLGTVTNPFQSDFFKDNENEICLPMLEKNRL